MISTLNYKGGDMCSHCRNTYDDPFFDGIDIEKCADAQAQGDEEEPPTRSPLEVPFDIFRFRETCERDNDH